MRVAADTSELVETINDGLPAGETYYYYVFIHVDELMVVSRRAEQVMHDISNTYRLKKDEKTGLPYRRPNIYLGAHISRN